MKNILPEWITGFLVSALTYAALFYFNNWITSDLSYGLGVNWIYLPAGLRLFLTLVFGLSGAIGIAIASFLISYFGELPPDLTTCIGVGLISGFAPYLAKIFVASNVQISSDLSGLTLQKLMACILIYALLSAGLHQWWFSSRGLDQAGSINHFLVMFIGDVLGTLLLIALIKYGLNLIKRGGGIKAL
ncbi:hypothetical protein [Polynucleobacter sp. CS-Odin-A6]|uniref:hypothetical protein n=1 Tax=Polynucleobacter sp. CS-Odin-A6 TaxID=2689106 RepID=UPI001C0C66AF|nr:hypothetical protein [Polynucleobacter sp. CS-Odin-A6]MBU3621297.1 hypothetical protein [Polynucleobacter sp. CS-Odin-A6]